MVALLAKSVDRSGAPRFTKPAQDTAGKMTIRLLIQINATDGRREEARRSPQKQM
jgi:hypothetical protein